MEWIINNFDSLLTAVLAVIAAASAIANLTPTESDNKVIDAVSKLINTLALNFKK